MLASLAARSLRQQLHRQGGAAALAAADWRLCPMAAAAAVAEVGRPRQVATQAMSDGPPSWAGPSALDAEKRRVREEVKAALRQLSAEQMAEESRLIAARLLASHAFAESPHAIIYVHCAKLREVDTTQVLQAAMDAGKRLYVPRVQDKEANMHFLHLDGWGALEAVPPFGIREPRPTYDDGTPRADVLEVDEPLELIVMPGLAFDRSGRRLGRGGGYYDKFIAAAQAHAAARGWAPPLLVALSFRAQLVGGVPVEEHDERVDAIVTPDEVIACSPAAAAVLQPAGGGGGAQGA